MFSYAFDENDGCLNPTKLCYELIKSIKDLNSRLDEVRSSLDYISSYKRAAVVNKYASMLDTRLKLSIILIDLHNRISNWQKINIFDNVEFGHDDLKHL